MSKSDRPAVELTLRFEAPVTRDDLQREFQALADRMALAEEPAPPRLDECPVCGAIGLPAQIEDHDCQSFLRDQEDS